MLKNLKIKIFSDGADIESIKFFSANPLIKGFTTNPTLMRKAGVIDYEAFAKEAIEVVGQKPISFEVFTDDIDEMLVQAKKIASWGNNVSVKIPVINTKGVSTKSIIHQLSAEGVIVNVTAIFSDAQIKEVIDAIDSNASAIVSISSFDKSLRRFCTTDSACACASSSKSSINTTFPFLVLILPSGNLMNA